jgi:4-alpha-glucanotransferase
MRTRRAGILLHPTSLPSRFGIGDLGPGADTFLDWAASAGQSLWQVMPVGPTGYFNSPYGCLSAFAGNPLLISPERLHEDGFLPSSALDEVPAFPGDRVDFGPLFTWKEALLRRSWEKARKVRRLRDDVAAFAAGAGETWLHEWSLFAALSGKFPDVDWTRWNSGLVTRDPHALAAARDELAGEIEYQNYLQYVFFNQWERVKDAAHERGILMVGDLPIYVAFGSADVWASRHLFTVGDDGRRETVAGVPPDYFSETGQLWGNPLYRWDVMEGEGYAWWIERLRMNFRLTDIVRIDHFRGFASYWEVPAGAETAVGGRWVPGPGRALFDAIRAALGEGPILAEDLGDITPDVEELLAQLGFPGMKILQFAFGELDSLYLPHNHVSNCVVYTGTHDNDTTRGWFSSLGAEERQRVLDILGTDGTYIHWDLIRLAYGSVASTAIVPAQDVFGLGSEARMNTPGRASGNWAWRATKSQFKAEDAAWLKRLALLTGRCALPKPPTSAEKAG